MCCKFLANNSRQQKATKGTEANRKFIVAARHQANYETIVIGMLSILDITY
jgi:hypothetical protein